MIFDPLCQIGYSVAILAQEQTLRAQRSHQRDGCSIAAPSIELHHASKGTHANDRAMCTHRADLIDEEGMDITEEDSKGTVARRREVH